MKKIVDFRKLLGVEKNVTLGELKTIYRNFMKEWHPDKFQDEEKRVEAEEKSKKLIEAYNFLVSISPETIEQALPEYTKTTSTANIVDYFYKSQMLTVKFSDGSSYEYYDVPANVYGKMVNAEVPARFARRNIFSAFVYRKISNVEETV